MSRREKTRRENRGPAELVWARAADGDPEALEVCSRLDPEGREARRQRLASTLALRAPGAGEELGPAHDAWRARLRRVAAHHMVLEDALRHAGQALGAADVPWLPIKGLDLCSRVYPRVEERPTSDIDLLVAADSFQAARRALLEAGYRPLADGPRVERYLREEGYAWQARGPRGALLELHYRLWGSVAPRAADAMAQDAVPDPELPAGGHRLRLHDAYVLAAVHLWLDSPRRLGSLRDLAMISRADPEVARGITTSAIRHDLQLPVVLAARWSAELWGEPACRRVAEELGGRLRPPEARWLARQGEPAGASYAGMTLARYRAGREARHGFGRLVLRRLWAHPGIVDAAGQHAARAAADPRGGDSRPWPLSRLAYQLRAWGIVRSPRSPT